MKKIILISIISLLIFPVNAQEREHLRVGNSKYEDKSFSESEIDFRKAINENQNSITGHYNLGNSIYKQGRQEEAIAEYDLVAKQSKDKNTKAQAFFNKGNALMKSKKLEEAIGSYKNSLRNDPSDTEARYNLAFAQKTLKNQQDQEKKDQDKNKDNKDKNDKDKDKKDDNKGDKDKNDKNKDKKDDNKGDKDKNDKNKDKKDDNKGDKDKNDKQQPQKGKMSKDDMNRLLQALKNQENETQKKVNAKKVKGKAVKGEKDW